MKDLRHAFILDDYPVDGLTSGEFHVYGNYLGPQGVGRLQIEQGVAYGEPFEIATADLRFEGTGVRLDKIDITRAPAASPARPGSAWDGNYSFDATGAKIPVESLKTASFPRAPLSGRTAVRRQRDRHLREPALRRHRQCRGFSPATKGSASSRGISPFAD